MARAKKLWVASDHPLPSTGYAVCVGLAKRYQRKAWWRVVHVVTTEKAAEKLLEEQPQDLGRAIVDLTYEHLQTVLVARKAAA